MRALTVVRDLVLDGAERVRRGVRFVRTADPINRQLLKRTALGGALCSACAVGCYAFGFYAGAMAFSFAVGLNCGAFGMWSRAWSADDLVFHTYEYQEDSAP